MQSATWEALVPWAVLRTRVLNIEQLWGVALAAQLRVLGSFSGERSARRFSSPSPPKQLGGLQHGDSCLSSSDPCLAVANHLSRRRQSCASHPIEPRDAPVAERQVPRQTDRPAAPRTCRAWCCPQSLCETIMHIFSNPHVVSDWTGCRTCSPCRSLSGRARPDR